jgi:hypothetical protein
LAEYGDLVELSCLDIARADFHKLLDVLGLEIENLFVDAEHRHEVSDDRFLMVRQAD